MQLATHWMNMRDVARFVVFVIDNTDAPEALSPSTSGLGVAVDRSYAGGAAGYPTATNAGDRHMCQCELSCRCPARARQRPVDRAGKEGKVELWEEAEKVLDRMAAGAEGQGR
jgi:hypothetical protein